MRPPTFIAGSLLCLFALCSLTSLNLAHATEAQAVASSISQESATSQVWLWPVGGERTIRLAYQAPLTEYGRGHRGIDIPADAGAEVRAPTVGIITFVGMIAGRGVISLQAGDYLVSYEPITPTVTEGEVVTRGQIIGTVAAGSHCDECVHVGVRRHDLYLSPMKLFADVAKARLEAWDDTHWARAETSASS